MSRLVAAKEDVGPTIERVVALTAVVAAGPGSARRRNACLGAGSPRQSMDGRGGSHSAREPSLDDRGPLSVALIGYLWAVGDASAVLRATLVGFPLMAIVMIPLLMTIGVPAVGFGWLAFGVGEGTVLIRSARKHAERVKPGLVPPAVFAAVGAAAGWLVSLRRYDLPWRAGRRAPRCSRVSPCPLGLAPEATGRRSSTRSTRAAPSASRSRAM